MHAYTQPPHAQMHTPPVLIDGRFLSLNGWGSTARSKRRPDSSSVCYARKDAVAASHVTVITAHDRARTLHISYSFRGRERRSTGVDRSALFFFLNGTDIDDDEDDDGEDDPASVSVFKNHGLGCHKWEEEEEVLMMMICVLCRFFPFVVTMVDAWTIPLRL